MTLRDSVGPRTHRKVTRVASKLPIEIPGKIICVGLNYFDHVEEEEGASPPEQPILFAKWSNALIGPGEAIKLPAISTQVDFEAELGVLIGSRARRLSEDDALEAVAGYVPLNDVTARDLQISDGQWARGKSLDTFCPVGPMVPRDAVDDPQKLWIRCTVNGELMQDSSTERMIFGVAQLIAFISEAITLEPGDLIATGTPAGVGESRTPPVFLKAGDGVSVEIENVGELTNPVESS